MIPLAVMVAASAAWLGAHPAVPHAGCELDTVEVRVVQAVPPGDGAPLNAYAYVHHWTDPEHCRATFVEPAMDTLSPRRQCDVAVHELAGHAVTDQPDQYDRPTNLMYGYGNSGSVAKPCLRLYPRPRARITRRVRHHHFTLEG